MNASCGSGETQSKHSDGASNDRSPAGRKRSTTHASAPPWRVGHGMEPSAGSTWSYHRHAQPPLPTRTASVHSNMRRHAVTVMLVVAAMAGCSGAASRGTVEGQYQLVGGPAPGLPRPQSGKIWAYTGNVTLAQITRTRARQSIRTDRQGNFTLRLEPGEYTLLGGLEGPGASARTSGCGSPVAVHVRSAKTSKVELVCSVP